MMGILSGVAKGPMLEPSGSDWLNSGLKYTAFCKKYAPVIYFICVV